MKKISVIVLIIVSFVFAAHAEAAKPKKRTRNANRVGAYGSLIVGMDKYTGDQSSVEDELLNAFNGLPTQNMEASTEPEDIGYQAAFGYRFNRYLAFELALAQYGDLQSTMTGEVDGGQGFVPVNLKLNFSVGGPVISGIGILPFGDHFEIYGRVGVLFASSDREFTSRIDGQTGAFGSAKGDSTETVLGLGATYHFNQVYSVRAEFQKIDEIGDPGKTGTEDLEIIAIGLIVRF